MNTKWIKWAAVFGIAAVVTACEDDTYRIKQEHNMDNRGMQNDRDVDQSRVNTNLPQGGSVEEKIYRGSQNIRPSDANGGRPDTIEGQSPAPAGSPAPTKIGPSHPHH